MPIIAVSALLIYNLYLLKSFFIIYCSHSEAGMSNMNARSCLMISVIGSAFTPVTIIAFMHSV